VNTGVYTIYSTQRACEKWIWTELIGFDTRDEDLGVGAYLDAAGFTPDAICLMITSPDFILSHEGVDEEVALPPDFCSRDGHEFNPHRQRQVWTNQQLKRLIEELQARGVDAYLTVFTRFYGDRFHHEWVSDHREVCMVFRSHGWASAINCLSRLNDGTYFQDYFAAKLVEVLEYYGFDGWHGADGYGPLSGPIYEVSVSDDMVEQFAASRELDLPDIVTRECGHDVERLEARASWIWRHARHEWIEFYADRWTGFWRKMVNALHSAGKKAVINSAWGRAPFESLYRYGVDYRKIVDTGVDGIIVETVAAGLAMDPRRGATDETRHYDFLSMLMLIKAYVPDAKLIFLHNTHDVVEEWDSIRHLPTLLEKEIYALANVFETRDDGKLRPCADGFLVCLGDGLDREHWRWLRERWSLAFSALPRCCLGATLVWSDAAMHNQVQDFTDTRTWTVHRLLFHLMARGAPVQSTVRADHLDAASGALLVLNPHLFPAEELESVFSYEGGPIVAVGRAEVSLPPTDHQFEDVYPPQQLCCRVYGAGPAATPHSEGDGEEQWPEDVMDLPEPTGYWDHFIFRQVSESFLRACADAITAVAGGFTVVDEGDAVTVMMAEQDEGRLRVALKNKTPVYVRPRVDVGRPIEKVDILTEYPSLLVRPEGASFSVRVPGWGITVVEVTLVR